MSSRPPAIVATPSFTTVLIIRHAEVHNPRDILYGRLPRFRLSSRGREQANQTARFLAARPLNAVYTSPLLRARQTADILTTYHPDVRPRTSSALLEVLTSYQGSPNSILKPGFSFFEPRLHPSDETIEDVWRRMLSFVQTAVRRHPGGMVVGVSHADPISILRIGLLGLPLTAASMHMEVYAARSSITQITAAPDGSFTVTYFNVADISELKL